MQQYAGISRALYLVVVALFALIVMVRALRRRTRRFASEAPAEAPPTERRVRAEARWRDANAALSAGRGREAYALGRDALVIACGEREQTAFDTYTLRELLRTVPADLREKIRPAALQFEREVYAAGPSAPGAETFLAAVRAAIDAVSPR